jgi:hypothetical protein
MGKKIRYLILMICRTLLKHFYNFYTTLLCQIPPNERIKYNKEQIHFFYNIYLNTFISDILNTAICTSFTSLPFRILKRVYNIFMFRNINYLKLFLNIIYLSEWFFFLFMYKYQMFVIYLWLNHCVLWTNIAIAFNWIYFGL